MIKLSTCTVFCFRMIILVLCFQLATFVLFCNMISRSRYTTAGTTQVILAPFLEVCHHIFGWFEVLSIWSRGLIDKRFPLVFHRPTSVSWLSDVLEPTPLLTRASSKQAVHAILRMEREYLQRGYLQQKYVHYIKRVEKLGEKRYYIYKIWC